MGCIKEADSSDYLATEAIDAAEAQANQDADGDPVNMVTGAFILTEHDLSIPTKRLTLDLTRYYNNQLHDSDSHTMVSGFGPGWTHSLGLHLEPGPGPGEITYVDDRGTQLVFTIAPDEFVIADKKLSFQWTKDSNIVVKRSGKILETFDAHGNLLNIQSNDKADANIEEAEMKAGPKLFQVTYLDAEKQVTMFQIPKTNCYFNPPAGAIALELTIQPNGELNLRQIDGLTARFDQSGKLIQLARPGPKSDSEVTLEYDFLDRLRIASDGNGRSIAFHYQGKNLLIHAVSDHTERRWEYRYNEQQELVEVHDPLNRVRRYSYMEWSGTAATGKGQIAVSKIRAMNKIFPFTEKGKPPALKPELINQYTSDRRVVRQKDGLGHSTRFDYNRFTYTTYMTNPAGWTTVYAFNANGNTTKVRKPCGGTKEFIYDDRDNLIAEIDEVGNINQYVDIKDLNRLDVQKDFGQRANGNRSAYVTLREDEIELGYDALGNRPLVRDALGNVTRFFEYNRFGRPQRVELPDSSAVLYKFDERSGLPLRTEKLISTGRLEPLTQVQEWQYDDFGNPIRYDEYAAGPKGPTDPRRIVVIEYDLLNNHPIARREWIESNGEGEKFSAEEKYTWDALGRLASKTIVRRDAPDGNFENFTYYFGYDALGRETWRMDPNNSATCTLRDLKGQVVETFLVKNVSTNELPFVSLDRRLERKCSEYDELGQQIAFIDPGGAKTLRIWDSCGRCIKITDPTGFTTTFTYDKDGNQITKFLQTGYELRTNYDSIGRPIGYLDNLGRCSERNYDPIGRLKKVVEVRDDQRHETQFEYNALGHLTHIIYPDRTIERFTIDEANNLVYHDQGTIDKPGQRIEKYYYDPLGRRTSIQTGSNNQLHPLFTIDYLDKDRAVEVTNAIGSRFRTFYDSNGNVIHKIDGEGRRLNLEYDSLNRLTQQSSEDKTFLAKYSYDVAGRMEAAQEDSVRYNWNYDTAGRLIRHEQHIGSHDAMLTYEYDDMGRLLSKQLDDTWWMRFKYLASTSFISQIEIPGNTLNIQTDLAGRVVEESWNDGGLSRYQFDSNGSLIDVESYDAQHQRVFKQRIERDSRGRPTKDARYNPRKENQFRYTYDQFNQLVNIDLLDDDSIKPYRHYVYDELGNRLEEHRDGKLFTSYRYDSANRLIERHESSDKSIDYDYDRSGNLIRQDNFVFDYDHLQRLRQVSINGKKGSQIEYRYTPVGDLGIISRPEKNEIETAVYDGLQQIVADKRGKGEHYFWAPQLDALKAVANFGQLPIQVYTDAVGSLLSINPDEYWQEYGVYGEQDEVSHPFQFGFHGKRYEPEINLYFGRARFYDPTSGRFTQPDPLGTYDSLNLYLYAKNNPLLYADPLGLASCKVDSVKDARGSLGVWPQDPLDLVSELGISPTRSVESAKHGTQTYEWVYGSLTIRSEAHSKDAIPGEPNNPRHVDRHYHVYINDQRVFPSGYTLGSGTGFLPGEQIPVEVYRALGI